MKTKYIRKRMEKDGVDFNLRDDSVVVNENLQGYILANISGKTVSQVASNFGKTKLGSKDVARIVATTALHNRVGGLGKKGNQMPDLLMVTS